MHETFSLSNIIERCNDLPICVQASGGLVDVASDRGQDGAGESLNYSITL